MSKSNSSDSNVSFGKRIQYLAKLVLLNARRKPVSVPRTLDDIDVIADEFERVTGLPSKESRVLEIGFGARPFRAFAFQHRFKDVTAVDLDQPIFGLKDFNKAHKKNGFLRAIKGTVRAELFDRGEWSFFHREMSDRVQGYHANKTRLIIDSAASENFWAQNPGSYDLVYSTDVFEHIPVPQLQIVLERIYRHLSPGGICITRPCVFTGIRGGHEPHWYGEQVESNASDRAWAHLWDSEFSVDTYLNRVTRREFVSLFEAAGFRVLKDESLDPALGERHLTNEIKALIGPSWDKYELFSNNVEFILKPNL